MSGVVALMCCAYVLTDAQIVYRSAELPVEIISLDPELEGDLSLAGLRAINSDIVGWLRIDDTDINYPVLQGKDNDYYLARNYKREWATAGSVFIDYRNTVDLSDDFTIIYGHRMSYGKMFSDITKFMERNYFNAHQTGRFYTENLAYELALVAFARVSATERIIYDVNRSRNGYDAIQLIYELSVWRREDFEEGRYILLSTCDAKDKGMRDVLLARVK